MKTSEQMISELATDTNGVRRAAEAVGNLFMSKPHLIGTGSSRADDEDFQQLLQARANVRAALTSIEDGITAIQQWRKG